MNIKIFSFSILCFLFASGCTFIAPYDMTTDNLVTTLQQKTDLMLLNLSEEVGTPAADYSNYKGQYNIIKTDISVLQSRASVIPNNSLTISEIKDLRENINILIQLHQNGLTAFEIKPMQDSIDRIFSSILKLEIGKEEYLAW